MPLCNGFWTWILWTRFRVFDEFIDIFCCPLNDTRIVTDKAWCLPRAAISLAPFCFVWLVLHNYFSHLLLHWFVYLFVVEASLDICISSSLKYCFLFGCQVEGIWRFGFPLKIRSSETFKSNLWISDGVGEGERLSSYFHRTSWVHSCKDGGLQCDNLILLLVWVLG